MSCEPDTVSVLRAAGQKITPQRMLILGALRHSDHRLSAYNILDLVRPTYPYIDVSTVYRTLQSAKDLGLVVEVALDGTDAEYEWTPEAEHYHLVCQKCGAETVAEGNHLRSMADGIERDYGFRADMRHMAIVGLCKGCAAATS